MDGELYTLRYRAGVKGVLTSFIQATSLQNAVQVGQTYCNRHINHQYISVEKSIIADESILDLRAPDPNDGNMIDESEMPFKPVRKEPKERVAPTVDPAVLAEIAERNRQEELEDEAADKAAAEEEAQRDAVAMGRESAPVPVAKAGKPGKLPKMPKGR